MIVAGIVAAEIAFWVLLGAGLLTRYLLRWRRVSSGLLLSLPVVDVLLLTLTGFDLARGAEPSMAHALAAFYLGFTIAFGHSMVAWADGWFAHFFAGATRPVRAVRGSAGYVRKLWTEWFRVVLAASVALGVIALLDVVAYQADPGVEPMVARFFSTTLMVVGVWFLAGPAFAGKGRVAALGSFTVAGAVGASAEAAGKKPAWTKNCTELN